MKKILKFIATYLCITILTAVGVVLIYNPSNKSTADNGNLNNPGEVVMSTTDNILQNIMSAQGLSVVVDVNIDNGNSDDNINLTLNNIIDLSKGFENIALQSDINATIGNQQIEASLVYVENCLYISALDGKYKITTQDLMSTIQYVIDGLDIDMPQLDVGSLDIQSLLTIFDNAIPVETEDSYTFDIEIFGLSLQIVTTKDYKIKNIVTEPITVGQMTITPNISIEYLTETNIVAPEDKYIDLTHILNITEAIQNLLKDKKVSFVATLIYNEQEYKANVKIDFVNGIKLQLDTKLFGRNIQMTYLNNIIYLDIDNIHFYFNISDIDDVAELLKTFDIDITPYLQLFDFASFDVSDLHLENINFANISLAVIKDIVANENTYTISLDDIGNIVLVTEENNSSINFITGNICVDIKFGTTNFDIQKAENNYQDIMLLKDTIKAVYDTIQYSSFEGRATILVKDTKVDVDYNISFANNDLYAKLKISVLGETVDLIINGQDLYLSFKDVHIHTSITNLKDTIDYVMSKFDIEMPDVDVTQIINNVFGDSNEPIKQLLYSDNTLSIVLFDDTNIAVSNNGQTIDNIIVSTKGIEANISLSATNEIYDYVVDKDKFVELQDIKNVFDNVYNYITSKEYYLYVDVDFGEYNVNGYINYTNNKLSATLQTVVFGEVVNIKLQDNIVYVTCETLHFSLSIEDIPVLVDYIKGFGYIPDIDFNNLSSILAMANVELDINDIDLSLTKNSLVASINGYTVTIDYSTGILQNITFDSQNLKANVVIKDKEMVVLVDKNTYYVDVIDLLPLVDNVLTFVENTNYGGSATISFGDIVLDINYQVSIINDKISARLSTEFYGIDVEILYVDNTIYISFDGMNIYANENEINSIIDWVNKTFGTNIEYNNQAISLEDISLDFIKNIVVDGNKIVITNDNYSLSLNINENISFELEYNDLILKGNVGITSNDYTIEKHYEHYDVLTDLIDATINTIATKQVSMSASATVYANDDNIRFVASGKADINLKNTFAMFGEVNLSGEQDMEFNLAYNNDRLYVNYDKLKVSFDKNSVVTIAYILFETFGIPTDGISIFEDVLDNQGFENMDLGNIQAIIPSVDATNPLSILTLIKGLSLEQNQISIILDGAKLSSNASARDVKISLITQNDKLYSLSLKDFYTGVSDSEYFDLDIVLLDFNGVQEIADPENYMDLSNVSGLLSAIINTSSLNDFHITATLTVYISLFDITIDVPIDIQIKLVENKPQIMATVGVIPTIVFVNNDVPFKAGDTGSGDNRILKIYYKDGYVYFYRSEVIPRGWSSRTYEKKLKITLEEFLADPMMILSYGCGFSDSIMDAINEAMDKANNRTEPINMSNILLGFDYDEQTQGYALTLNLRELANNDDLDTMTVILYTSNVDDKTHVTRGVLDMYMPISSGFTMSLKSNDLALTDIGQSLDFSELYNFVNNYTYNVDEKWTASNGSWELESKTVYTVYFEENGGYEIANITGAIDTPYTLVNYEDRIYDDGVTRTVYKFVGWYTTPTFEEGTLYTNNKITRGDLTLYAKWDCYVYYYHTISFVDNIMGGQEKIHTLVGQNIDIPQYETYSVSTPTTTTTYKFVGWYTDQNYTYLFDSNVMPNEDVTLYAKWEIIDFIETKLINIYDNNVLVASVGKIVGEKFDLYNDYNVKDSTLWYLDSEYKAPFVLPEIMPDYELNIHIRNKYVLSIYSQYGDTATKTFSLYQGEKIVLPTQSNYYYDDGTQTQRTYYTFVGYDNSIVVVPNYNISLNAIWNVDIKLYYTVTFDMTLNYIPKSCAVGCHYKVAPTSIAPIKILDGETLDLTPYTNIICEIWATVSSSSIFGVRYSYRATTWGTSVHDNYKDGGDGFTSIVITQNTTLYPYWEKI